MANKFERTTPRVSIIIPSWFTKTGQDGKYGKNETTWFALECMDRLLSVTPRDEFELIIIDNGSNFTDDQLIDLTIPPKLHPTDGLRSATTSWYWKQADILIRNEFNLGFAPACNQGFDLARGEYIVCMNNDILVWEGWLDAMLLAFQEIPKKGLIKPGVVMPALLSVTKDAKEAIKIKEISLKNNFERYGNRAEFGSLWVAPKKVLDKVRGLNKEEIGIAQVFDEHFRMGMGEDRKLWQQIRMLGYETYRTHKTRVFHQGNLSVCKIEDRKQYTLPNREYLAEWKKKHNLE